MNKHIFITIVAGFICGVLGFFIGRSNEIPREDYDTYRNTVQEGIHDYKRHYFASREKMLDLFEYIDDRETWFYRDIPDSFRAGTSKPQCVIGLFGNLNTWRADYLDRTQMWDAQVNAIEKHIGSAVPH